MNQQEQFCAPHGLPNAKEQWRSLLPEIDIIPVVPAPDALMYNFSASYTGNAFTGPAPNPMRKPQKAMYKNPFDYTSLNQRKNMNKEKQQKIENKTNKWSCMICSEVAQDKESLIEHYDKHRLEKQANIKQENQNLQTTSDYFVCPVCSKEFTSLRSYEHHTEAEHGEKKYICEKCNVGFKNCYQLCLHNHKAHTTDGLYRCTICDCTTNCKKTLKQHIMQHKEVHKYKCEICGKGFTSATWYEKIFFSFVLLYFILILLKSDGFFSSLNY